MIFGLLLLSLPGTGRAGGEQRQYVGSESCKGCHAETYAGWKQTRMANVIRDPKVHPEAVLADFTHADPLVTFELKDVAFVYGSKWKQRFFTKRGDDYFVQPAQWDVAKKRWLPYHVEPGTDWWEPFYGKTNEERPTGPLCDGCHSVNYNVETKQVTESIAGRKFDWPVGYTAGDRLADVWRLEELKPGVTNFFQYADLTAHKNRMQGNDFIQSNMYHRELRCFDCHQVHNNANPANLKAVGNALCLGCHAATAGNPAGLTGTVAEHTHHAEGSKGSECVACHMPRIEQTIKDNFVASHTFRFITPALTEQSKVPNPCTSCHQDKGNAWALKELQRWGTVSPWRMGQPVM